MTSVSAPMLGGFFLAVLPFVLTPGVSFTLTTQRTLAGERRSGEAVASGTAIGIYIHAVLAALGLSAIVMASSEVSQAIKLLGAAYLIGLGLANLRRSFTHPSQPPSAAVTNSRGTFAQAAIGDVLNVKAAAIYLTLAPQFIAERDHLLGAMLALATIHVIVSTVWLITWSHALRRGRHRLDTRRARAAIDRVAGCVLVALGIRAANGART